MARAAKKIESEDKNICLCGCGRSAERRFRQGHDMRLRHRFLEFTRGNAQYATVLKSPAVKDYLVSAPWMTAELKKFIK